MPYEIRDKGRDEDVYVPTPEEETFLEESLAQFERGESFDWDEVRVSVLRRRP
jgi:hypothetical protein